MESIRMLIWLLHGFLLIDEMLTRPHNGISQRRNSENEILKNEDRSMHERKVYLGTDVTLEAKYYQLQSNTRFYENRPGSATETESCEYIRQVPLDIQYIMEPYGIGSFYQKYTEAYGIPVIGSENVDDNSLKRACYVLRFLLADRESLRHAFYNAHGRIAIIAQNEKLRDLPEFDFLPKLFDKTVRALAGTPSVPVTAIGEENLLCFDDDTHRPEDMLVRELAISILLIAFPKVMPKLRVDIEEQYQWAMASGLWENTFANVSPDLYLGEAVQSFFNVNGFARPADGQHNEIKNRIFLQGYDSGIFDIITEMFPCGNSMISRCSRRGREREKHQDLEMNCPAHRSLRGRRR